jgi:hypothetical protein
VGPPHPSPAAPCLWVGGGGNLTYEGSFRKSQYVKLSVCADSHLSVQIHSWRRKKERKSAMGPSAGCRAWYTPPRAVSRPAEKIRTGSARGVEPSWRAGGGGRELLPAPLASRGRLHRVHYDKTATQVRLRGSRMESHRKLLRKERKRPRTSSPLRSPLR